MGFLRFAALATGITYLGYRLVMTNAGAEPVLFVLLLAAETFGVVRFAIEASLARAGGEERVAEVGPTVTADILIVVTDESASEVRAAVLAAGLVDGRAGVCVVDHHDRTDVAELCRRLQVARLVGAPDADRGALLNTAIDRCRAPFVVVAPADHVVMPDALSLAGAVFQDPSVAVVVSRVDQVNAISWVDYPGYGEERVRTDVMAGPLDAASALPWWPGMSIVRCAALGSVGGMSTGQPGSTLATGVRLAASGWRIVDVPVAMARRLASWNDDHHLHRWARDLRERLDALSHVDVRTDSARLPRQQRLALRLADLQVARSVQRLTLIAVLVATMYSSALPLVADPTVLVPAWGAWHALAVASRRWDQRHVMFVPAMANDLRLLPTSLVVAWQAFRRAPVEFDPAEPAPGRRGRAVFFAGLQIVLSFSLLVFGTGLARSPHGDFATLATLALSAWLLVVLLNARADLRQRQVRQGYRTAADVEVMSAAGHLTIVGVSAFGVDVVSARKLPLGAELDLSLALPRLDGTTTPIDVSTSVVRSAWDDDRGVAYLRFRQLDDERLDRVTEYVAVVGGRRGPAGEERLRAGASLPAASIS